MLILHVSLRTKITVTLFTIISTYSHWRQKNREARSTALQPIRLISKRVVLGRDCMSNHIIFRLMTTNAIFQTVIFDSIQFSLFPAHVNISYNIDNVHITCRKRGRQNTVLLNVHPQTLTVVNYEHNYYCL